MSLCPRCSCRSSAPGDTCSTRCFQLVCVSRVLFREFSTEDKKPKYYLWKYSSSSGWRRECLAAYLSCARGQAPPSCQWPALQRTCRAQLAEPQGSSFCPRDGEGWVQRLLHISVIYNLHTKEVTLYTITFGFVELAKTQSIECERS